jgi:PAS domain-containing protein
MEFSQIARLAAEHGRPLGAVVAPDRWVSERLARHGVADGGHVQALADGRWVQINELRTSEGGIVGIYTDITEVKAEDARARARELGERNLILQSTLDTLSEGVCMFDSSGRLSAWNGALGRLLGLGDDPTRALTNHDDLLDWCRRGLNMDDQGCLDWRQDDGMASPVSQLCPAGERRFEVRSTRNGQGGQVFSFTDVTDMLTAQAALRETAETLERRVSERTAELMSVNERLGQEVAERRTIEAALIQAKIAAEKANLSKTSFLAAASHDLLQPLNAACLFVAALGDRRWRCPRGRWCRRRPRRWTRWRICSRRCSRSRGWMQARSSLKSAISASTNCSPRSMSNSHRWRAPRACRCGSRRGNLGPVGCAAAAPYSPELHLQCHPLHGGRRGARHLRGGGDQVKVAVIDTGRGIAVSQQALIFEEFRRLDTRSPGKGLGLAIVRRAADMLGHRILLHSAPGGGDLCHHSAAGPRGGGAESDSIATPRDRTMQGCACWWWTMNGRSSRGCVPCWADGDAMWRWRGMRRALRLFGQGERPDVILADYHLNDGETGDRVIARLQDHFGVAVPCVMISADRGEGSRPGWRRAGRPC